MASKVAVQIACSRSIERMMLESFNAGIRSAGGSMRNDPQSASRNDRSEPQRGRTSRRGEQRETRTSRGGTGTAVLDEIEELEEQENREGEE